LAAATAASDTLADQQQVLLVNMAEVAEVAEDTILTEVAEAGAALAYLV
jgi:hypothetical protein